MSERKRKPTRWYYVLACFIPIFACLGSTLLVYSNVPDLPGALERKGINDLTQVVVPGSAEIDFPKAGAYAVYYEYHSAVNGVQYVRGRSSPDIHCQLKSKATGEYIELAPDFVEGNIYETKNQERAGVLIKSINIDQPGGYIFSCQYRDGRTDPKIVLAVGPNIVWEFFNIAVKPVAACVCGSMVFVGAFLISVLIIGIVAVKRHQSTNDLPSQA